MTAIRWFDNLAPAPRPSHALAHLARSCLIGLPLGFALKVVGLALAGAGQGTLAALLDLVWWALALLPFAVVYLTAQRHLVARGRFGLASAALLGLAAVLAAFLLLWPFLPAELRPQPELAVVALDLAVTYGTLTGTVFWLRLARAHPAHFLAEAAVPRFGRWLARAVALVALWQVLFRALAVRLL